MQFSNCKYKNFLTLLLLIKALLIKEYYYNVFTLRFDDPNSHELQENGNIFIWLIFYGINN